MEKIYLFSGLHINEVENAEECDVCGNIFAVIRIDRVSEQSGSEYHHEGHVDDYTEGLSCPYCPRVGDEIVIKETKHTKELGVDGARGLVIGPITDKKVPIKLRKPVHDPCSGMRYGVIVGAGEVVKKKAN